MLITAKNPGVNKAQFSFRLFESSNKEKKMNYLLSSSNLYVNVKKFIKHNGILNA